MVRSWNMVSLSYSATITRSLWIFVLINKDAMEYQDYIKNALASFGMLVVCFNAWGCLRLLFGVSILKVREIPFFFTFGDIKNYSIQQPLLMLITIVSLVFFLPFIRYI